MTDDEINIAIAEACGWRFSPLAHIESKPFATMCWIAPNGADWQMQKLPDYCNDLNAMHEAEQSLWDRDWSLRHEFVNNLARIMNPIHGYRMQEAIDLLDATARQRAEAFLRAIGKWEEDT